MPQGLPERTVMIDWTGVKGVRLTSDRFFDDGYVTSVSANGEVRWRVANRLVVESSHSTNITIRGGGGWVDISGNPSKFLQGHNLCGTDQRVRKLLDVLGQTARTKRQAPVTRSGTVIFGERDRRQKLVLYHKSEEFKKHAPSATMAPTWRQLLTDHAAGKLRAELRLGSKWFHENPDFRCGRWWDADFPATLLDDRLGDVEVSDTMRLNDDAVLNLPPKLVPVYDAWRAGRDLQAIYSRRTFYRYRRQLLDLVGIDILHVQPREVVTETQYLGGEPVGALLRGPRVAIPTWAIGTDLLAS